MIGATLRSADSSVLMDVRFSYDVFGNRIEKKVDSNGDGAWDDTLRSAYLDNMAWADFDGSTALTHRYMTGDQIDQMFARVEELGTTDEEGWYLTNHLGSVVGLLDDAGDMIAEMEYDAWGNLTSTPDADADRFGFTGREWDEEIDLYYYRARHYDPATGDFIEDDPIGFLAGDANTSRYVGNDPLTGKDPYGLYEDDRPWWVRLFTSGSGFDRYVVRPIEGVGRYGVYVADGLTFGQTPLNNAANELAAENDERWLQGLGQVHAGGIWFVGGWQALRLPTYSVGVGPGQPVHVMYGAGGN